MREGTAARRLRREVVVPGEILAIAAHLRRRREIAASLERRRRATRQELGPLRRSGAPPATEVIRPPSVNCVERTSVRVMRAGWPGCPARGFVISPWLLLPVAASRVLDRRWRCSTDGADEVHALADAHATRQRDAVVLVVANLGDAALDVRLRAR